jgi:hypothetical protein
MMNMDTKCPLSPLLPAPSFPLPTNCTLSTKDGASLSLLFSSLPSCQLEHHQSVEDLFVGLVKTIYSFIPAFGWYASQSVFERGVANWVR